MFVRIDPTWAPVAINAALDSALPTNPGNRIQFNFPASNQYEKAPADGPIVENLINTANRDNARPSEDTSLFVGFPYCIPTDGHNAGGLVTADGCGFCGIPVVALRGAKHSLFDRYIAAVEREIEFQTSHVGLPMEVGAVFFGGGTPNLLSPAESAIFIGTVLAAFQPAPGAEVTWEGIPYLFRDKEKFDALKNAGVNRVSIGAQSLNPRVIQHTGRFTQTRAGVELAVQHARDVGFEHSVDLIYGLPAQTYDDALEDVRTLVAWKIPHLTIYPLNQVPGLSAFSAEPYASLCAAIPERLRMYHGIRDFLLSQGYRQVTMSDFEIDDDRSHYEYENKSHDPLKNDWWALGYMGHHRRVGQYDRPGFSYLAPEDLGEYYAQLDKGRLPVRATFRFEPVDVRLSYLLNQLQRMRLDANAYEVLFGIDLLEEYRNLWDALLARGWIEIKDNVIQLIGDAVFYTALIQRALTFARDRELKARSTARIAGWKAHESINTE